MSEQLTITFFQPLLKDSFYVNLSEEETAELVLTEANPLPSYADRKPITGSETPVRKEPFSLIFRSPVEIEFVQQIFHLHHDTHGAIVPLFLVPVGMDSEGRYYESIIN